MLIFILDNSKSDHQMELLETILETLFLLCSSLIHTLKTLPSLQHLSILKIHALPTSIPPTARIPSLMCFISFWNIFWTQNLVLGKRTNVGVVCICCAKLLIVSKTNDYIHTLKHVKKHFKHHQNLNSASRIHQNI